MAKDFGASAQPSWRRGQRGAVVLSVGGKAALVAGLLLIASLPAAIPISIEQMNVDKGPSSNPIGKPCGRIPEALFSRGWATPPRTFTFVGATFTRHRGDADCSSGRHGLLGLIGPIYPVCEFDAPVELAVTSGGESAWFDVRPGYTAVVEARPDGPRCTITGLFRFYPSPAPRS